MRGLLTDALGTRLEAPVDLVYEAADPWAVSIVFATDQGPVPWTFARSLLREGLARAAGLGDVVIRPGQGASAGVVEIWLQSHEGRAHVELDRSDVADFFESTLRVVPLDQESAYVELGALAARLLSETG